MASSSITSAPRRLVKGTKSTVEEGNLLLGKDLNISSHNTRFIQSRLELFEKLYTEQQEDVDAKARCEIEILYKDKLYKGASFETTPLDILSIIDKGLIKHAVVAKVVPKDPQEYNSGTCVNVEQSAESQCCTSHLWDLVRPLEFSCSINFLTFDSEEGKGVFWHSSAHILGAAMEEHFGAFLTVGPPLERGFYYDAYLGDVKISQDMYSAIVSCAKKLINLNAPFQRLVVDKPTALELFKENPFKTALIKTKVPEGSFTSVYRCGNLVDLCRGPHVPTTGRVVSFMVDKHSSAYWLGDAKHDSLQRVYGISFPSDAQMKEYEAILEKAKKSDHRLLGSQLNLFFFDTHLSPGSCFWLPDGAKLYNRIANFIRNEYRFRGFTEVISPNIFSSDLFKISGHWKNYKDNMYCFDVEGADWALKPMNCPGHCLMFQHIRPSYKQLPLRFADFGVLHRNEISGSLTGLFRVRRFQQDDAHIFCHPDQIQVEVMSALNFLFFVYEIFGFKLEMTLSTRPVKAMGTEEQWKKAEEALAKALDATGRPWRVNAGDGAFYGPKIDVRLQDALQRWHQCGTVQLDFQLPLRFNLMFRTDEVAGKTELEEGLKKTDLGIPDNVDISQRDDVSLEQPLKPGFERPVMIHRAILGSIERMLAVLLEHTGGKLPFWLSPRQILVCPISKKNFEYAERISNTLRLKGFECSVDVSNSTINKKIRQAQLDRWTYVVVVGCHEEETSTLMVRECTEPKEQKLMSIKEAIALFSSLKMPTSGTDHDCCCA